MSHEDIVVICSTISAILGPISLTICSWMAFKMREEMRIRQQADHIRGDQLQKLQETADLTQEKTDVVHDIVNGSTMASLTAHALTARRLSDITKQPADVDIAGAAEKALQDFKEKRGV